MQSSYAATFERDYGCVEADWLRWLPGAVRDCALEIATRGGRARVGIGAGALQLVWQAQPPRRIGMAQFPRLLVSFRFEALDETQRASFMRYFDLYMQRGGG